MIYQRKNRFNQMQNLTDILSILPETRGSLKISALSKFTWFRVGGDAIVFTPKDEDDLISFLQNTPKKISVMPLGLGSNTLFRDGGFKGVVVRMSPFSDIELQGTTLIAGCGATDIKVAKTACMHGLDGLAFLSGIPGAIGGALAMNAGAYGSEVKDIFQSATAITRDGTKKTYTLNDMNFAYRHCAIKDVFFTSTILLGTHGEVVNIQKKMDDIKTMRSDSQPIKERTGGSTFQNPIDNKAWELIDKAGLRGKTIGGAKISEHHCNFLINMGEATASDLENLGDLAKHSVKEQFNINLTWEIKLIGDKP